MESNRNRQNVMPRVNRFETLDGMAVGARSTHLHLPPAGTALLKQRRATNQIGQGSVSIRIRITISPSLQSLWRALTSRQSSFGFASLACLVLAFELIQIIQPQLVQHTYAIDSALSLLPKTNPALAQKIIYDKERAAFSFNAGYSPGISQEESYGGASISATAYADPAKGLTILDPINQIEFTLKPLFKLYNGQKDGNRIIYPLMNGNGWLVYTMQGTAVKEDIVLKRAGKDSQKYTYAYEFGDSFEARKLANGGIGIFGSDLPINGQVSVGTDTDTELLKKMRVNSSKSKLFFSLPAPVIFEAQHKRSSAVAEYIIDTAKKEVSIEAQGLSEAEYPLTIDPSVYVETAQKFMRGNNESNIDFNVDDTLIEKGRLTGARINKWEPTMNLNSGVWNQGTAVAGGFVYTAGGTNGSVNTRAIRWAKFDTNTNDIVSPNPGSGPCSDWCSSTDYQLPAGRSALSLVAYNGFLYAIGGRDASCTTTNGTGNSGVCNTVYVTKIGVNGEPQLWHPTNADTTTWDFWHTTSTLPTERAYSAAVAYNNRIYLLGGQRSTDPGGITTVRYTDLNPNGSLGSWLLTTPLVTARYSHNATVYNGTLYVLGGMSSGTVLNSVRYNKINTDGTLSNTWVSTNPFSTARHSWGGNFAVAYGGYLYVVGGCTSNASQCSSGDVAGDMQLASLNADGTISDWSPVLGVNQPRIGYGLVAWRHSLYAIGGCTSMSSATNCSSTQSGVSYGAINLDGDASTVNTSVPSGTGTCTGGAPTNCDIPPAGDAASAAVGGRMSSGTIINNGYIYIIGGCATSTGGSSCSSGARMSGNTSYAALSPDGSLASPAVCPTGATYGTWCVDSTNQLNGTNGIGAMATAVFNNVVYVIGGTDGNTSWSASIYSVGLISDGSLAGAWNEQDFNNIGMGAARGYSFALTRANPSNAGISPGNLFVIGGCSGTSGIGCSTYYSDVYKCDIATDAVISNCTTSGQLSIDSETGTGGTQGLGLMAGVEYANYIYLIGGSSPNQAERGEILYAKIDSNNNIVAVTGSAWQVSPNTIDPIRRRSFGFGYNGYLYSLAGYNPSDSLLNDLLYAKIDVSDGSIGPFQTSQVTVSPRWDLRAIVSNGYVYAIGGCSDGAAPGNCTQTEGSIQTFQLYNNYSGSPAGYTNSNQYTQNRMGSSTTVLNGYIYIAGGCNGTQDCNSVTSNVQYAKLQDDGSIGAWTTTTDVLSGGRAWGKLVTVGGSLYYMGGQNASGTIFRTVYYATPSGGDVINWQTATNQIPIVRTQFGAAVWNNRIYITGGYDGTSVRDTIFISPILSSGGNITSAWQTSVQTLPTARSGHVAISYANNLYTLGGYDGSNYLSDVAVAKIDPSGDIGTWVPTTSLPQKLRQSDGFAANGYLYLFGGRGSDAGCTDNTFVTPISANTTIASGNNPTGLGQWYATNAKLDSPRYGATAAYEEGKTYVLGGGCITNGPSTAVMQDDFDAAIDSSQWTSTGTTVADTNCSSFSGRSLRFTGSNANRRAQTIDVNVQYGGSISFYLYAPTSTGGSCRRPAANETLILEYSTNGGGSWTTLNTYTAPINPIIQVTTDIPASAQTNATRFRWRQNAANNSTYDNWALDNIIVSARGAPSLSLITGSQKTQYSTLLSQPQVSQYSIMIDADTNVFPSKWVANGLDNDIGARWSLKYRSALDTTANWGQETNAGVVDLGVPSTYTPVDSLGSNTVLARYYYLLLTIDSSRAFGYPEDVSRGPTIYDITLQFTSDPSKRLKHGKTFTGGQLQPLDTPF